MVVHAFPEFYEQCRTVLRNSGAVMAEVVRFSPEYVRNRVYGVSAKYWNRCGDSNRPFAGPAQERRQHTARSPTDFISQSSLVSAQ
ncbi:hypothetical protein B296_00038461 [Ensete ventricosum]|uniref:Uncharacterized protein n=1 Tax=Ensete ventricosum TaxID=4639 RepID=A0A426Z4K2_ENSVE|nr:hypothetical protein B296_00038461 [Ensete ventricosum]